MSSILLIPLNNDSILIPRYALSEHSSTDYPETLGVVVTLQAKYKNALVGGAVTCLTTYEIWPDDAGVLVAAKAAEELITKQVISRDFAARSPNGGWTEGIGATKIPTIAS
jgi:hypothetical protein